MAQLVVLLQRTPRGIHPGSQIALCVARDIASKRGASVTAVCMGEGGEQDEQVRLAVQRFGGDRLFFLGDKGLQRMVQRLEPLHIFSAASSESIKTLKSNGIAVDDANRHWLRTPKPSFQDFDPVTTFVAGTLPWHNIPGDVVFAEYEESAASIEGPRWLHTLSKAEEAQTLYAMVPPGIEERSQRALDTLKVKTVDPHSATAIESGTLLWLNAASNGLPIDLNERPPELQLLLLPGPEPTMHPSWELADWVLAGPWPETLQALTTTPWSKQWTSLSN